MRIFNLFIVITLLLSSCDVIEEPYLENEIVELDTTGRNVLLMEMTGIHCPNCPSASKEAERIIKKYKGKVIGLNIHSSSLANPKSPTEPNFRTQESTDLHNKASNPALPAGFIGNLAHTQSVKNSFIVWEGEVENYLKKKAGMDINCDVSNSNDTDFDINIDVIYKNNQIDDEKIGVYLSESEIVGFQLDGPTKINDYVHNYVLRKAITNSVGNDIFQNKLKGDTLNLNYNLSIDPAWVLENLNLVILIYSPKNNDEVLQVIEKKLTE